MESSCKLETLSERFAKGSKVGTGVPITLLLDELMGNMKKEGEGGTTATKAMARIIGGFVVKDGQFLLKET